jgi:hypothetical protein
MDRAQALAATILVRSTYTKCATGPLLCLALEISPTRALAHYSYFPFNVKNQAHGKYLSSLAQTGRLQLNFLARGRAIFRECDLTPAECRRIKEQLAEALEAWKTCAASYSFAGAVSEFENTVRVPQFFERAMSDSELIEALQSVKMKADKVSVEKRALAHQVVRGLVDVLMSRWGDYVRKQIETLPKDRTALLFMFDFLRVFGDDYDRIVEFFADGIAGSVEEEVLRKSSDWPSKLDAILKLIDRMNSAPQAEQEKVRSDLSEAVGSALSDLGSGRGPSLSMLQNMLLPLRPLLLGQPGRPPKDYSREHEWKVSGLSWSDVATQHLIENTETRAEFGGREFASLTFEQKENLRNRIRAGVTSFAERAGKPLPRR